MRPLILNEGSETTDSLTKKLQDWARGLVADDEAVIGQRLRSIDGGGFDGTTDPSGVAFVKFRTRTRPEVILVSPQSGGMVLGVVIPLPSGRPPDEFAVWCFGVSGGGLSALPSAPVAFSWLGFTPHRASRMLRFF